MPPRVVHCRTCRRLLNEDLQEDSIVEPAFLPLKEVEIIAIAEPRGVFQGCPACGRELRINRKYAGQVVRCKQCQAGFTLEDVTSPADGRKAFYTDCPHCRQELRIGIKYLGQQVACKFCAGQMRFGTAAMSG